MKSLRLLTCILLASASLAAQNSNTSEPASVENRRPNRPASNQKEADKPQAPPAAASGLIVQAATGAPLKKAIVSLMQIGDMPDGALGGVMLERRMQRGRDRQRLSVMTDGNGRFAFKDVEPGRYRMVVERNGYVRTEFGAKGTNRQGTPITLNPGQKMEDLSVRMLRAGTIAGRVVDEDGEALQRARVQALRSQYRDGQRSLVPVGFAQTNDLGEYRLFGLSPGQYYVSAAYTPGGNSFIGEGVMFAAGGGDVSFAGPGGTPPPDEGYAPVYYPGTTDLSSASPLDVKAADEIRADLYVTPTRTVRVRGWLRSAGGQGMDGMVTLLPRENGVRNFMGMRQPASARDEDGAFEIRGVVPGAYTLMAMKFDEGQVQSTRMNIDVGTSDVENLVLAMQATVELPGRVRIEGATNVKPGSLRVMLRPGGDGFAGPMFAAATVKEDSTFVLPNVGSDRYRVNVMGLPSEDYFLKAIRVGNEDALESGLDMSKSRRPGTLDITISARGARVEGTVLDLSNKAASGARVVLVPDGKPERSELYKIATTDQNGKFGLRGISPGDYALYAWEDVENGAWQDPEFLKKFDGQGKAVRITEGEVKTSELHLIPAEGQDLAAGN